MFCKRCRKIKQTDNNRICWRCGVRELRGRVLWLENRALKEAQEKLGKNLKHKGE